MKNNKTPYFLFNPEILKNNYRNFEEKCKIYFPKFKIAYSVKTNSYEGVIKNLSKENSCFEVASINEINSVLKYSKNNLIVFNSPNKPEKELKLAIKNKFLINVDSKSEINKIADILKGKPLEIGLRVSIKDSKFGFDEDQLQDIINYCTSINISVIGLHLHFGTQLTMDEYRSNIDKFSVIIYFLQNKGIKFKYIDIGGGFPDKIQLKNLSLKLDDFFDTIKRYLGRFDTEIILEPGRALVSDSFTLITKVCIIKENFGNKYAILDAGINLLPKITLSSYKFSKLNPSSKDEKSEDYILAGPLLFSNDVLGKFHGSLNEGDLIEVENVGAYCYNLAWEISYKKPKIFIEKGV